MTHIVHQVAAHFPRHVDARELAAVGALGLVQAAHRYDPSRGIPFNRFASHRVRGAILDSVRRADWAPRSLRKDARAVQEARQQLAPVLGRSPSPGELGITLGLAAEVVARIEAHVVRSSLLALDDVVGTGDDDLSLVDALYDRTEAVPDEVVENQEMKGYLRDALHLLPERHRRVIEGVYLEGRPAEDVAVELDVTPSRVSQLRSDALEMLREGITAQYDGRASEPMPRTGRAARRKAAYAAAIARQSEWRTRLVPSGEAVPTPAPALARYA